MQTASGEDRPTIAGQAFLSDCQSSALVGLDGCVNWWCAPRFDSPSVFARLLGTDGGFWRIAPEGRFDAARSYRDGTLVLATVFRTPQGVVELTDALALGHGERGHDIGRKSPHSLIRRVACLEGAAELRFELEPRPSYGLIVPRIDLTASGAVVRGAPDTFELESPVPLEVARGSVHGRFRLREGQAVAFRLSHRRTYAPGTTARSPGIEDELRDTCEGWTSWSSLHQYDGLYADSVRLSALVLQGLTFQPSGAVVAAATTSLPEEIGGDANWDYRFAWLRDLSLTMQAQWVAACPHEPTRFFHWLADAMGHLGPVPLQIMYGAEGERRLDESELTNLSGYENSRPVRVGNAAWQQRQVDVLGEVMFVADLLRDQLEPFDARTVDLLTAVADEACEQWREPDAGMWEARDQRRHYTTSKVMCWVALDRALRLGDVLRGDVARWARTRSEIRETVLREAWSDRAGAFAGALGSDELDASLLLLPLVGFLPADDPRMGATIEAIRDRLADGALVRRWDGDTAGFLLTSFWLVECLALRSELDEATARFDELCSLGNDLGLFAEMAHPSGELQGNFPQAFSHVGLVNAAWRLTEHSRGRAVTRA